ncbi:MAG: ATP-binding protein [Candidatus Manganitrophus sp.]|nr:ATP-binding protein [Candidatus Manganitrophus sp.]
MTAELASVFRSAVEKAGMRLSVDCPPAPAPVYVDREMWEKIVLNLLSNAFKFTFEGEIAVALPWTEDRVELIVRDTGIGIPQAALPHLFERFYRVKGARARTHEGSGIGLALVQELVRLHGGTIGGRVRSIGGQPLPSRFRPARRIFRLIGSVRRERWRRRPWAPFPTRRRRSGGFLKCGVGMPSDEAVLRLTFQARPGFSSPMTTRICERISKRILGRALDGRGGRRRDGSALEAARECKPDLVLSDVMMPGMNGFQLLQALRADPRTREVPIILLSARAGEESRVEGLEAGADDYLMKPFSARELMARVGAHLELARLRREVLCHERELRAEAEAAREEAQEANRLKSQILLRRLP